MFYSQIVRERKLPLELKIPNNETIAALNEDLSNAPRFDSIDDLMADLHS
jgi:DNA-damage-inducible protein J